MKNRLTLLGVMTVALAAGPVVAAEMNPWRLGGSMPLTPPQAQPSQPTVQMPSQMGGYNYAPLDGDPSAMITVPRGIQQNVPTQNAFGYGAPYGGYAQPWGSSGLGYPGLGYPGVGLGYPGLGYPGAGWGGSPYGWDNGWGGPNNGWGGLNGFSGPFSWMPFW